VLTAVLAVPAAALAVPAAALAAGKVWVIYTPSCILASSVTTAKEQYKPAKIVLGCSQHEGSYYAKLFAKRLHWSKWTGSTAIGSGLLEVGSCSPSCKRGKLTGYAVKMTLGGPKRCPGAAHPLFTTATFTFPKKQPPSPTGQGSYGLPCGGPQAAADSRSRVSRPPPRAGS
jgi:hypothetical protein